MELRHLGDSLLRKRPSQVLQFLAPSVSYTLMYAITNPSYDTIAGLSISKRPFASYSPLLQAYYSATAAAAPSDPDPRLISDKNSRERSEVRALLDESLPSPSRYNTSDSKAPPNFAPRSYTKTVPFSSNINVVSSSDTMETHYRKRKTSYPGAIADNMHFTSPGHVSKDLVNSVTTVFKPRAVRTIKSHPSVGRTVEINSGQDLSRALRKLEMQCNANNVRRDQILQRFHERPGLKRKRLARERWRSRFKEGFYAVLCKVRAMRKKGW